MQRSICLGLLFIVVSLTGCHSTTGNVVPQRGPSMEEVYDSMGENHQAKKDAAVPSLDQNNADNNTQPEADLNNIRRAQLMIAKSQSSALNLDASQTPVFHFLPNPELKLYVYPHFAGQDEVPIPGYYTVFNAYEKTYYALPTDTH